MKVMVRDSSVDMERNGIKNFRQGGYAPRGLACILFVHRKGAPPAMGAPLRSPLGDPGTSPVNK